MNRCNNCDSLRIPAFLVWPLAEQTFPLEIRFHVPLVIPRSLTPRCSSAVSVAWRSHNQKALWQSNSNGVPSVFQLIDSYPERQFLEWAVFSHEQRTSVFKWPFESCGRPADCTMSVQSASMWLSKSLKEQCADSSDRFTALDTI